MFTLLLFLAVFIIGLVLGSKKGFSLKAQSDGLYLWYNTDGTRESSKITSLIKS